EVHFNHACWLLSYADFITLFFSFFVLMSSLSQVNQSKYRVLSETFEHAFNSRQVTPDTTSSNPTRKVINPIQVGEPALSPAPSAIDITPNSSSTPEPLPVDQLEEISSLFNE